jgi:hypothetical protein
MESGGEREYRQGADLICISQEQYPRPCLYTIAYNLTAYLFIAHFIEIESNCSSNAYCSAVTTFSFWSILQERNTSSKKSAGPSAKTMFAGMVFLFFEYHSWMTGDEAPAPVD